MFLYRTAEAAVSLHDAHTVDITRVGLTVEAKPGAVAASYLVACEASLTLSTVERTLVRTADKESGLSPPV